MESRSPGMLPTCFAIHVCITPLRMLPIGEPFTYMFFLSVVPVSIALNGSLKTFETFDTSERRTGGS